MQSSSCAHSASGRARRLDRLPPGRGACVRGFFAASCARATPDTRDYEAPNPEVKAGEDVAREALAATRAVLP